MRMNLPRLFSGATHGGGLFGAPSKPAAPNRLVTLHDSLRRITGARVDDDAAVAAASPEAAELLGILDGIEARDVGVDQADVRVGDVAYVPVVETDRYHVGVFVLGPQARIPLHDHPGMTVLSRVLRGSVTMSSFDLLGEGRDGSDVPNGRRRRMCRAARHAEVELRAPCAAVALDPHHRNVHEFTAGADGTAILDVIVPPYDATRRCTYYYYHHHRGPDTSSGEPSEEAVLRVDEDDASGVERTSHDQHPEVCVLEIADPEPDFSCATLPYKGLSPWAAAAP